MQRLEARRGFGRLMRAGLFDPHLEIVPGSLTRHRIAVGKAIAAGLLGQQLGDQMVEQKSALGFGCIRDQGPRARALADVKP